MATADPKYIRSLVRIARDAHGQIDGARVAAILQALAQQPPREHRAVLRAFQRVVGRELAQGEVVIEHAGELDATAVAAIKATLEQHYGRSLTTRAIASPTLLAGFRARVGDDVWDTSATGRLARLTTALSA